MELTKYDRELLQLYRDAGESGKLFIWDLLACFVCCGEDFIQEIQAVAGDKEAMRAVVAKWKATIPAEATV